MIGVGNEYLHDKNNSAQEEFTAKTCIWEVVTWSVIERSIGSQRDQLASIYFFVCSLYRQLYAVLKHENKYCTGLALHSISQIFSNNLANNFKHLNSPTFSPITIVAAQAVELHSSS